MSDKDPKIVAFLCTWCSYAGADLAGTGRNQYPPNIRVIRVPCSGRINPLYIIKALLEGADGVMVSGCHPGDCHYLVGNYYARRRFTVLKKLLTVAGFEPDRVHFTWVSASEGVRFADVVKEVTEKVIKRSVILRGMTQEKGEEEREKKSSLLASDTETFLLSPHVTPVSFSAQQNDLSSICKDLLNNKIVNTVIGYQKGGELGLSLPCFIDSPDDIDKLIWNDRCVPMLSGYLSEITEKTGKTAIIAKPCDACAVVSLIKENQLKRDDVYIVGLVCDGMVNSEGELLPACKECNVHTPPVYDVLIGEKQTEEPSPCHIGEKQTEEPSPCFTSERFLNEMSKCILCYSCRQSCYGCYCKTCFMERGEPDWQTSSPDTGAKMLYHLGRTTHLSGRCVECGACENACASGVDIRYLIKEITHFIEDTYDYKTGMDLEAEPAMLTYKTDDPEIGFLGHEQ